MRTSDFVACGSWSKHKSLCSQDENSMSIPAHKGTYLLIVCIFSFYASFLIVAVAPSEKPYQRDFRFRRTEPVTVLGCLPYIVTVQGGIFIIFPSPVTHAQREVDVQTVCDGQRVTVFHACRIIRLVPKCPTGFTAHVTFASPFEIVCECLPVNTYVMPREWLFISFLSEPFTHGDVTAIDAPVTVVAVLFHQPYIQLPAIDQFLPK